MRDDGEPGRIEVVADVEDLAARDGRTNRAAVKQIGEGEIVDVAGRAGDFLGAFLSQDVLSDRAFFHPRSDYAVFLSLRSMIPTTAASSALRLPRPRDDFARPEARLRNVSIVAPSIYASRIAGWM